jgi:hypothetical protein
MFKKIKKVGSWKLEENYVKKEEEEEEDINFVMLVWFKDCLVGLKFE